MSFKTSRLTFGENGVVNFSYVGYVLRQGLFSSYCDLGGVIFMAASCSSDNPKIKECLICYEEFGEGERIRIVIDPFHEICRACLKALRESGETQCPFRCEVLLPELEEPCSPMADVIDPYLKIAYEIGKFIHSFVTENSRDGSEKSWAEYESCFSSGPNPYYHQTKRGLVLEAYYGMPTIHTPYGIWRILGSGYGYWDKLISEIVEPLGLKLSSPFQVNSYGSYGPTYAITQWKEIPLDYPEYRPQSEYVPRDKVKEIWKAFAATYPDLEID